jgi:hypothetical protein
MDATLFNHIIPSLQQTQINPHKLYFQKRFQHAQVFLQPHELGYLKSVTSLKQMRLTLGSSMQAYKDEIASSSLIKLTISIKGQDAFNVGWLLSIFPSLEELVIDVSSAMLIAGNKRVIYPKLRKLRVEECIIHPNLLGFITTVAPNIQKLAWSLLGKSYHHMIIKKHYRDRECRQGKSPDNPVMSCWVDVSKLSHLEMFKLQINRGQQDADREYDIYGTIKVQGQTKKLVFSENYKPALEVTHNKEAEMEDLPKMSKVTVICDQIKRLEINYNIRIDKDNDDINVVL